MTFSTKTCKVCFQVSKANTTVGQGIRTEKKATEQAKDLVDIDVFIQLFDLDERCYFSDDRRQKGIDSAFSREILSEYAYQASKTLQEMEAALKLEDLPQLFSLSLFLEGSSASLGANRIKDTCRLIRRYSDPDDNLLSQRIPKSQTLMTIYTLLRVFRIYLDETTSCMEYHYRELDQSR